MSKAKKLVAWILAGVIVLAAGITIGVVTYVPRSNTLRIWNWEDYMPESVIKDFIENAEMFNYKEKHYCFFSKSGFTDAAKKRANESIKLIDFNDSCFCITTQTRIKNSNNIPEGK